MASSCKNIQYLSILANMVKALSFKGDKKQKKRKRVDTEEKFGESSGGKEVAKIEEGPADDDSWFVSPGVLDLPI
jgi:protein FRG1